VSEPAAPPLTPDLPYPTAVALYPRVRQSMLSQFDRCALSTGMGMEYEEGWSSHPQARGQLMHVAFAKCLTDMYDRWREKQEGGYDHDQDAIPDGTIPEDVATAILMEVLRQADVEPRDVVTVPMDQVKDMAWVIRKWAREARFAIEDLVDVEQRLQTKIAYPGEHGAAIERYLTGALDALFIQGAEADHAVVIDWKDTWGIPGPTEVSFEGYFQQRFYAMLVFDNYPSVQACTLREVYPRFSPGDDGEENARTATVFRSDLPIIREEMGALVERLDRAIEHGKLPWTTEAKKLKAQMNAHRREALKAYEAKDMERANEEMEKAREFRRLHQNLVTPWAPSPGQHCGFCPRPTACPIFPTARGAGRITDQETAERVAAETIVAEAASKKGKASLKEWADKNGDVPVKDAKGLRVWGHKQITRTTKPDAPAVQAEIDLALQEGRKPDVARLYRTSAGSRFEMHAPKPMADNAGAADADLLEKLEESVRQAEERKKAA
jgi:hypothetical protein